MSGFMMKVSKIAALEDKKIRYAFEYDRAVCDCYTEAILEEAVMMTAFRISIVEKVEEFNRSQS